MRKPHAKPVEHDEYGRPVAYYAEYHNSIYGGSGIFTKLDAAIFYVVSGIFSDIDWATFPGNGKKYPYEERNGNETPQLDPLFVVDRMVGEKHIHAIVKRWPAMDEWVVGNGIAEASKKMFLQATGRDLVKIEGQGDFLKGTVK